MNVMRQWSCLVVAAIFAAGVAVAADHTQDSLDTVKNNLAAKKAVLVDVREKDEWDDGHITGALHAPLSDLKTPEGAKRLAAKLPKKKIVYTHCAAGVRSLSAAKLLRAENVDFRPLKQGYDELIETGFKKAEE